ncbi:MAG TPA: hypothetical protein VMU46_17805 [Burkholderiales bacterium]|nr:hypothetical protein [Burkholderiales bacterium]
MIRALALVAALAGCAEGYRMTAYDEIFMSFEHEFTDQAIANVRKRAENRCQDRKLAAIKLTSNCSLSKCYTTYQCVDKEDASTYSPAPPPAPR